MKKRHVLAIALLAVFASHLAVYLITSCAGKVFVSEFKSPVYPLIYRKPGLWNKSHLTWRVSNTPPIPKRLDEQGFSRNIEKSFKAWEQAGVFTFAPSAEKVADITISFRNAPARRWDGRLGLMGVGSYPWGGNRGNIYLDPDEIWSNQPFALLGDPITDWLPHEIGHVLGLPHVVEAGYIMSVTGPYGLPDEADFSLLRKLYAPRTLVPRWIMNDVAISTQILSAE